MLLNFRHGPLVRMSAIRYEAKHRYFKRWATIMGNFKNIAKTLADHHQRYLCYLMASDTYLDASPTVGPGTCVCMYACTYVYVRKYVRMYVCVCV